jgi:threonine/homoserine/homoserine lactone efflux protein
MFVRPVGQAIGQTLPTAVGVAISPLPIVAVVLMLATPRGRLDGPAFILGWWIGLAVIGAVALSISSGADASDKGAPATWVDVVKLVLGLLLLLVGARQWRGRPAHADDPKTPKWMGALDSISAPKAVAFGAVFSGLNPKNLLLTVSGAAAIAGTGISAGKETVAWIVFVLVASLGVGAPIVIYFALGDRSGPLLGRMKTWMVNNNAAIMAVLVLILGVKLIGDAVSGFST